MDFSITIDGKECQYEQYEELIDFIRNRLAHWNNFRADEEYIIVLKKVPSKTETLGVSVDDIQKTSEHIS
jgi:hypothetical protein